MAVDLTFYKDIYGGAEYSDINRLLIRAERAVENAITVTPESDFQQRQYDFAVCAQAEYIGLCGGVEAWEGNISGTAQSFTVGSFSMSQSGSSGDGGGLRARGISSSAESYLERGGLLYRGCAAW